MKAARIPTKASTAPPPIYQLHIELRDLKPVIWRRVLVPQSVTLAKLHQVIQIAMGWTNSHLHEFTIGRIRYGMPSRESIEPDLVINEKRTTLQASLPPSTKSFSYSYDFGDGWEHTLRVEKTLPIDPAFHYPLCMAGANACPPEDIGGPPGYVDFVQAISDPAHPEHEELLEWCGGTFDPFAFNLDAINAQLRRIKL